MNELPHENIQNSFQKRIGKTTYIVFANPSESAKMTLEEKYKDMCIKEVLKKSFETN